MRQQKYRISATVAQNDLMRKANNARSSVITVSGCSMPLSNSAAAPLTANGYNLPASSLMLRRSHGKVKSVATVNVVKYLQFKAPSASGVSTAQARQVNITRYRWFTGTRGLAEIDTPLRTTSILVGRLLCSVYAKAIVITFVSSSQNAMAILCAFQPEQTLQF